METSASRAAMKPTVSPTAPSVLCLQGLRNPRALSAAPATSWRARRAYRPAPTSAWVPSRASPSPRSSSSGASSASSAGGSSAGARRDLGSKCYSCCLYISAYDGPSSSDPGVCPGAHPSVSRFEQSTMRASRV